MSEVPRTRTPGPPQRHAPGLAPASAIGRRRLLARGLATGVIAWTAPVVISSLAAPAAALSCSTCIRFQVVVDPVTGECVPKVVEYEPGSCPRLVPPECPGIDDVSGFSLDELGLTHGGAVCIAAGPGIKWHLYANGGICPGPRSIVAVRGETDSGTCHDAAEIVDHGDGSWTAVLGAPGEQWRSFEFVLVCGCA